MMREVGIDTSRDSRKVFAVGKPVLCEKPMDISLEDSIAMVDAAESAGVANNMVAYNYIRTPASQLARQLIANGEIGDTVWFRGEQTEDFDDDPTQKASWRNFGEANGCLGDLAPHLINAMLALIGPISELNADVEKRGGIDVENDDQLQVMCRFENGAMGHLYASRTVTGRKMGCLYEITGTKGAIRFDQEDQTALWLYRSEGPEAECGFKKILTGPAHPDFVNFCLGAGHGTGYQDQIIIEARVFLKAIETGEPVWPTFRDGFAVAEVANAIRKSSDSRRWVKWRIIMTASLTDFIASLKDNTPEGNYKNALKTEYGIPFYDGTKLHSMDGDELSLAKQEWVECWKNGAGVLIISDFYPDTQVVDDMSNVIYKILDDEELGKKSVGDHFAKEGANKRIWNVLGSVDVLPNM